MAERKFERRKRPCVPAVGWNQYVGYTLQTGRKITSVFMFWIPKFHKYCTGFAPKNRYTSRNECNGMQWGAVIAMKIGKYLHFVVIYSSIQGNRLRQNATIGDRPTGYRITPVRSQVRILYRPIL